MGIVSEEKPDEPIEGVPLTGPPLEAYVVDEAAQALYQRRTRRTLGLLVLIAVVVLVILWFVDPRQSDIGYCGMKEMTGLDCPGCGGTRATHVLLHGGFLEAFRYNAYWAATWPLWIYITASVIVDILFGKMLPGRLHTRPWFWIVTMSLLMLFGLVRNLPFYPAM